MAISWANVVAESNTVAAKKAISQFMDMGFIAVLRVGRSEAIAFGTISWRKINNSGTGMVATTGTLAKTRHEHSRFPTFSVARGRG